MKFAYFDESGAGDTDKEPVLVMAGVVVDAYNMHITKGFWKNEVLKGLSKRAKKPIEELHYAHFYKGKGVWHDAMTMADRREITTLIINWIRSRRHRITFSAIDKREYQRQNQNDDRLRSLHPWCAAAMHCLLTLQREYQKKKYEGVKGHVIAVFDRETRLERPLTELKYSPPAWTGEYYNLGEGQEPLSQIEDVPYFADSRYAVLLQIADLIADVLRGHAEFSLRHHQDEQNGEARQFGIWADIICNDLSVPSSERYKKTGRNLAQELFWNLAPESLRR